MRIGSLCSGYGGLEMGVQAVLGGTTVWVSDIDKGARKILAHRFPDVPNLGDMTTVDWSQVELVDLICGGTPCQDLSHAGKRAGMTEGTRSNLWVAMREAIATIRPRLVVWENVGGAYSARADSDVERESGLLGDGAGRPALRALGRVLGDLASLGYDASWHGIRASDIGAPHGRLRVFVVATDTSRDQGWQQHGDGGSVADTERGGCDGRSPVTGRGPLKRIAAQRPSEDTLLPTPVADHSRGLPSASTDYSSLPNVVCSLLPTPTSRDHKGRNQRNGATCLTGALLPTPLSSDAGPRGGTTGFGLRDTTRALGLLPTPTVVDSKASGGGYNGQSNVTLTDATVRQPQNWGQYAAAIHHWESLTRPAPSPTELGAKGSPRLSAAFSEWMMGLPAGWVTDVPGITRNEALKALGNGVVPQQAAAAIAEMLSWEAAA